MEDPKENETPNIEKRDFSDLREHLKSLIERIGGLRNVAIVSDVSLADRLGPITVGGDVEGWWSQEIIDPKTKKSKGWKVHVPARIMESSENVAKGSAAHEAGHVAISRHHWYIPDQVMQEPGFHQLITSVEELPTDQVVRDRYPGAGRWVDETRAEHGRAAKLFMKTESDFGYIPGSIRLNQMIIHGRQIQDLPEAEPYLAGIKDVYEKIKEPIGRVEHTIPEEEGGEDEAVAKSKERYKIVYKEIWPEVKKLVEEDIEKEKLRQMLEQAARQAEKEKKKEKSGKSEKSDGKAGRGKGEAKAEKQEEGEAGEESGESKEGFSDEENEELMDALKQMSEDLAEELNQTIEEALNERRNEEEKNTGEEEGVPMRRGQTPEEDSGEQEESTSGEDKGRRLPVPMDKLSERLIEALKKAFEKLPKHIQEKLKEMAKAAYEEIEDEFVKEYSSELVDSGETHEEYRARIEEETAEAEKEKRRTRMIQKSATAAEDLERREAALHKTRELYDQVYEEEIRELDDRLYRELEEIFTPNIKREMRLRSSGSKINLPAVFRWESDREGGAGKPDDRIFEQTHLPEKKDYAFTILNDLSASMRMADKIKQDFRAKILFAEVLNRLGVKNEILGFQDRVIIFKKFSQELNDDIRKKMSGIELEAYNKNPGGNNCSDYSDDGPCLLDASNGLGQEPAKEKFLIVISDGIPAGRHSTEGDITAAIKKILGNTDQKLIGLGLGRGTEHVKNYYPTSLPNITVKELTDTLGQLLKDMIVNPAKYKYTETRE